MKNSRNILESSIVTAIFTLLLVVSYALLGLLFFSLGYKISNFSKNLIYTIAVFVNVPLIIFLSRKWKISIPNYVKMPSGESILIVLILSAAWFSIDLILFSIQDYQNLSAGKINIVSLREIVCDRTTILSFLHRVLLSPVIEEMFFRVLLVTYLLRHFSLIRVILISSFLFALAHLRFNDFLSLFFTGGVLSFLFYKKQSLLLNILFHSILNFILFIINMKTISAYCADYKHLTFNTFGIIIFCALIAYLGRKSKEQMNFSSKPKSCIDTTT